MVQFFVILSSGWVALSVQTQLATLGSLLLEEQVASMNRRAFAQLQFMDELRPFLDDDSLHSVTQALVISHLDYCNVLYMGLLLKSVWKLQLVQSVVARAVFVVPRMAHITPLSCKFHWLRLFLTAIQSDSYEL